MSKMDSDFLKKLIQSFYLESKERINNMSDYLLELEKTKESDKIQKNIEAVYREIHTLKSAARSVNFQNLEQICQKLEDLLYFWKNNSIKPKPEGLDVVHDINKLIINWIEKNTSNDIEMDNNDRNKIIEAIDNLINDKKDNVETKNVSGNDSEYINKNQKNTNDKPFEFDTIKITANKLDNLFIQTEEMLPIKINLETQLNSYNSLKNDILESKKEWEKFSSSNLKHKKNNDYNHELYTLGQNQLKSLLLKINQLNTDMESELHNLNLKIDNLLDDSKKILLLPFSTLLNIFPKIVRDLARNLKKEVNIEIIGAEIEIDKRMLEALKDIFMHLIRNAVDHGIELPSERINKNKNAQGNISIIVQQPTANEIIIKIKDDGSGINLEQVKKSALKKGFINSDDINEMTKEEALDLIFKSGVSTNPILTDLSGRGLGMSIIKEKIENISGQLLIDSELDKGTLFTIKLPLSIATFKGTLIKIGQNYFIIPTNNLEKIIRKKMEDLGSVQNQKVINYQNKNLSLLWLSDILGLPREKQSIDDYLSIAIISNGEKKMAFVIDEILNEHEIIVKNFSRPLTKIRYISAATLLGSDTIIPILNISDLLDTMHIADIKTLNETNSNGLETLRHILLAEDSITTRNLLKNILELSGYQVTAAIDGMEAWNLIALHPYSIVVSDVDMPNMNGFELTEKIRNDNKYEDLPIVLVTSRETPEDKVRGIDVGANAYLTKSTFDSSYMLEIISRLAKNS